MWDEDVGSEKNVEEKKNQETHFSKIIKCFKPKHKIDA